MKKILIIVLLFLFSFPNIAHAKIDSIRLFDFIEIKFLNPENKNENTVKPTEPSDPEFEYVFEEELVNDITINEAKFINDYLYIFVDIKSQNIYDSDLYINWFLMKEKLKKDRYFTNNNQIAYRASKDRFESVFSDGFNNIYLKHKKSGINSETYKYYFGDIVTYDGYTQLLTCDGKIDRVIARDETGWIIYDKKNYNNRKINPTYLRKSRRFDNGFYDYEVYCSNALNDLYFVYHFWFKYRSSSNRIYQASGYGTYYQEGKYNKISK